MFKKAGKTNNCVPVSRVQTPTQHVTFERFISTPARILAGSPSQYQRCEALILLYIKTEEQLRKLFCFLARTEPHCVDWAHIARYVSEHKDWQPSKWINSIDRLHSKGFFHRAVSAVDEDFRAMRKELEGYKPHRDRLFHGVTVNKTFYRWLENRNRCGFLIHWLETVGAAMTKSINYDGIQMISALKRKPLCKFPRSTDYLEVKEYLNEYRYD